MASILCVGSNEPSILTARSVGLTASSQAQVGSSLESDPTTGLSVPKAAPSVSRSGAAKIKNSDSAAEKESQDLVAKRSKTVKKCLTQLY